MFLLILPRQGQCNGSPDPGPEAKTRKTQKVRSLPQSTPALQCDRAHAAGSKGVLTLLQLLPDSANAHSMKSYQFTRSKQPHRLSSPVEGPPQVNVAPSVSVPAKWYILRAHTRSCARRLKASVSTVVCSGSLTHHGWRRHWVGSLSSTKSAKAPRSG